MEVTEFQQWVNDYYENRGWSELDIFIRIGFLAEETGEVARAIRALEIGRDRPDEVTESFTNNRADLVEELGLAQATISQHLKELRNVGLIQGTVDGTSICYCINPKTWEAYKQQFAELFGSKPINQNCC